jgi:hypothetical protein
LLAIPLLLLHLVFTIGIAFALSAVTTAFRDVAHFTEVGLVMLFWTSPIVYTTDMAPPALQAFFHVSPPAAFAIAYQDLLYWHRLPEASLVLMLLAATVASVLLGRAIFRRLGRSAAGTDAGQRVRHGGSSQSSSSAGSRSSPFGTTPGTASNRGCSDPSAASRASSSSGPSAT